MNYRIPKIEEFVEGFTFEVYLKSGGESYFLMNCDDCISVDEQIAVNRVKTIEEWKEFTVSKSDLPIEWNFSFSIPYFLKEKKIRTKQ